MICILSDESNHHTKNKMQDGGRERGRERKREEGKQSKEWVSDPLIQNEGIHKSQAGCGR